MSIEIHNPGNYLYLLYNPDIQGYVTWEENDMEAIMAWTHGGLAEQYAEYHFPDVEYKIRRIPKNRSHALLKTCLDSGIFYMLINVVPEASDPYAIKTEVSNYALIDLKKVKNGINY